MFVLAFDSLASGPSIEGYGYLQTGSQALPWFAAVVVATVFAGVPMNRVRFGVGGLALASGFFGAAVGSMWGIGGVLANYDAVHQPPELNSLLLAFWTSSVIIAPTAIVFAVGAALLAATGAFVRWISLESYDRAVAHSAQPPRAHLGSR